MAGPLSDTIARLPFGSRFAFFHHRGPALDFVNIPLSIAAALTLVSVSLGLFSTRWGISFLLVFLVAGMVAGEQGLGGLQFNDFVLSFWVGNVALAVILLDGGLRTAFSTFRVGLKPSLLLATLGVALCAALTGVAAAALLKLPLLHGMLLGAIVGSTDAAAVFALLKRSGVTLNERVGSTLEIESGMNDPMAIFLTLMFITIIVAPQAGTTVDALAIAGSFVQQFGLGVLGGVGAGYLMAVVLNRVPHADPGVIGLMLVSAGLTVFAATGLLGGSGFLAVYVFGMMLANRAPERVRGALSAMDGYAWLAQAGMFLLLGLLVTPSRVLDTGLPALGLAAVLMLVARPVAVWACLLPFRYQAREVWFIAWVGLRGAVPIVLAVFPLLAGVPDSMLLFNVAFVVVLASLTLQGTSIAWAGRRLGVALPDSEDEPLRRAVFGDFVLDAQAPIGPVCEFYGLPVPPDAHLQAGDWLQQHLGKPAVVGDAVQLGSAVLIVRAMDGPIISMLGLKLEADQHAH
ncbi:potassium/proton antiporter [Ramlibacter sp. AN1015]|uniref:potassium/proton antiporter n=1 Tax=Ramlibacter sp. AN1015 TaxID=3133428 RepID=UPI0030C5135D